MPQTRLYFGLHTVALSLAVLVGGGIAPGHGGSGLGAAAAYVPRVKGPECPELEKWFPECWVATHARIAIGNDRRAHERRSNLARVAQDTGAQRRAPPHPRLPVAAAAAAVSALLQVQKSDQHRAP
jgi:hypothetical protein